jgi:hypothetical protein
MTRIHVKANYLERLGEAVVHRAPSKSRPGLWHYQFQFRDSRGTLCTCEGWQMAGHCWHVDELPPLPLVAHMVKCDRLGLPHPKDTHIVAGDRDIQDCINPKEAG